MQIKNYQFIYLDQNIYGELSSLNTNQKRDYFTKMLAFSILVHRVSNMKFVYNLTTLQETNQIKGKNRTYFIDQHLRLIKLLTQGNYLIKTGKYYTLFRNRDPFILFQQFDEQKHELLHAAQHLLQYANSNEEKKILQELILQEGDYNKVFSRLFSNLNNQQSKESQKLNNYSIQGLFDFLENKSKQTYNEKINTDSLFRKNYFKAFNTYDYISISDLMQRYGVSDFYTKNMAEHLLLELVGYKALTPSKASKKPESAFNDSSIFAYVLDVITIFVSNDRKLVAKLRDRKQNCQKIFNLDEFIDYIEKTKINLSDGKIFTFGEIYKNYLKPPSKHTDC